MKQTILCSAFVLLLCGLAGTRCHAQQPPQAVYLNQSRDWRILSESRGGSSPLAREMVRQAFLIAARDELGLCTRDAWLGDAMPTQGDNAPWDVVGPLREPFVVEIVRGFSPNQSTFVHHEMGYPARRVGFIEFSSLTPRMELMSRAEYVEGLKKAGFQGRPNIRDESIAVPEKIEKLLGEMNFVSQFRAIRQLHEIMHSQGESSAVVGALSRGYANLGVMTEYYWHPAHKVFKARALLYAQRILARDEKSPIARWHRAYAAALAGMHDWVLDDLRDADKAFLAIPEADRPAEPAWAKLIRPLCEYKIDEFDQFVHDPDIGKLAVMLKFITVEQAGGQLWAVQTATETLKVIPECYRVHDSLCEFGGVSVLHSATIEPIRLVGKRLYRRLESLPGLPESIHDIIRERTKSGDGLLSSSLDALFGVKHSNPTEAFDFEVRRQLIDALFKTGEIPAATAENAGGDDGKQVKLESAEPSWATLGLLIRELSFMQVYRRAHFERWCLCVPTEEWLASSAPLVQGHPYRAFFDCYAWESDKAKEAWEQFDKVDPNGLGPNAYAICNCFGKHADSIFFDEISRNYDNVVRDIVIFLRHFTLEDKHDANGLSNCLLYFSPYSPMARAVLIENGSEDAQAKLDEWDKASAPYPNLSLRLGTLYLKHGRLDDAERCLMAAIKVMPSDPEYYRQLAKVYLQRGQTDLWLATLKTYLKQPDYGLAHFQVQSDIAYHFMYQREWEKALPYAQGAASSYSGWGLLCAADCYEALQQWEEAERHYRACSERYRSSSLDWYLFCRRTGEGDVAAAREFAQQYVKNLANSPDKPNSWELVTYYLLEEQPDKALAEMERALFKEPDVVGSLWMALVADQLKDSKKRDAALLAAKTLSAKNADEPDPTPSADAGLVDLLIKDLAQGGNGQLDLNAIEKLDVSLSGKDRFCHYYVIGQYLNLHGRPEIAEGYWKRCMGWPRIEVQLRTLAGAALDARGVTPAEYKSLLQPKDARKDAKVEVEE